jgi:long-chain fatty acid transport protein
VHRPGARRDARGHVIFRLVLSLAALLALVALPRARAHANPAEVFGFGSRQAGMGGAAAARVDDFSSVYYNPAGLAASRGKHVAFGLLGAASHLSINDRAYELSEPFGFSFGATAPAPLGGVLKDRLFVGVGMYMLPTTLVRVIARLPSEPFYPWYDNRTQRIVILPGLAVRVNERFNLGVALDVLAGLGGQVVAGEGPTRALDARVDEEIPTNAALHAGFQGQLYPGLAIAFAYRGEFGVPFTTISQTTVAGEPIDLAIKAKGLYTPHTFVLGFSWKNPMVDLALDGQWALWSQYPGPFVAVDSELPLVGPLSGILPDVPWKDSFGARLGAEKLMPLEGGGSWALRGGYGFETSPVPAQQPGVTNLLDGPKHTVSAGVGFRFAVGEAGAGQPRKHLRIDVHAQAQLVGRRTLRKVVAAAGENPAPFDALRDEVVDDASEPSTQGIQVSNPGYPSIRSGGEVFSGGLTMELEL